MEAGRAAVNKEEHVKNMHAHLGLDHLGFPHQLINQIVFRKAQQYRCKSHTSYTPLSKSWRAVDIGCGTGYLLKKFLDSGWNAIGLDPFPRGESLAKPICEHVIQGTIEAIASNRFDLVTAVEVIEHSADYLILLQGMRRILAPGGRIITTVPNSWEFHTIKTQEGLKEPKYGHLWKFDAEGLRRDLEALFVDVGVATIYSRWLDRRFFRFLRHLPLSLVMRVSDWIIGYRKNGAWLLGWGARRKGRLEDPEPLPKPSAIRYLEGRQSSFSARMQTNT